MNKFSDVLKYLNSLYNGINIFFNSYTELT